jgi:hypothetical protein
MIDNDGDVECCKQRKEPSVQAVKDLLSRPTQKSENFPFTSAVNTNLNARFSPVFKTKENEFCGIDNGTYNKHQTTTTKSICRKTIGKYGRVRRGGQSMILTKGTPESLYE